MSLLKYSCQLSEVGLYEYSAVELYYNKSQANSEDSKISQIIHFFVDLEFQSYMNTPPPLSLNCCGQHGAPFTNMD